jgi:hypothetical protein
MSESAAAAPRFTDGAFVRAHLWKGPLYLSDGPLWTALLRERERIAAWFAETGLLLMVDEAEGFAYLRQIEQEGDEKVPRLVQKRKLTYDATLLLVCLRDELNRFDARTADQVQLVKSRRELMDLVAGFLPETTDQVRDGKKLDSAIEQLRELGFLRRLGSEGSENYEVSRVIKARFGPGELETVRDRLRSHVQS